MSDDCELCWDTPHGEWRYPLFFQVIYNGKKGPFYIRGVRVLSCDTLADPRPDGKLYPSDHFPVSAEVAL